MLNNSLSLSNGGFTLVEMIVVVALIALISVFAVPSISNLLNLSLKTSTRELASTLKEASNSALITGKVHRIVYDFTENKFWVESGPKDALLESSTSAEREKEKKRFQKEGEAPKSPFQLEKTVTRKKISLPTGVKFKDVISEQSPDPVTEGLAYTHIFPQGITEKTIIHLEDSQKHETSLVVSPLLGKIKTYDAYVDEKEAYGK